jgi:sensor histidine kinase regulating citrate/malate metabolism
VLIVIIFNIISYKYDFSNDSKILVAGSSLLLIFSVILTCIHQQAEMQRRDELAELREEAREREVNKAYFDLIEKQNSEMQIFAHDINNHLQNIYSLSGSEEEAKKYIKMLSNDIKDTGKYGKSPNKLLDLIVGKYEYLCKKEDIAFETNIHYFNLSFIDENDVASLLNNLLDNALEASRKSKTKEVSLGINKIEQMVFIDVTNSCDSSPNIKNGFPVTTKKDTGLHGYGFKSIMKTVKKYNGDLDCNYDKNDHVFTVSILFKIT